MRVQVEDAEIDACVLGEPGDRRTVETSVRVAKGDRVYFRFTPATAASAQEIAWSQDIAYQAHPSVPADPNGRTTVFSWAGDFSAAGRPATVGLNPGKIALGGVLAKARTSDDVVFGVTHGFAEPGKAPVPVSVSVVPVTAAGLVDPARARVVFATPDGRWCVTAGQGDGVQPLGCYPTQPLARAAADSTMFAAETGRFRLAGTQTITNPGGAGGLDTLAARLGTTSPVDPGAVEWVQPPSYCYLAAEVPVPTGGDACAGAGGADLPVSVETYPVNDATGPRTARFTPPQDSPGQAGLGRYGVGLGFDRVGSGVGLAGEDREVWLSFKGSDGCW